MSMLEKYGVEMVKQFRLIWKILCCFLLAFGLAYAHAAVKADVYFTDQEGRLVKEAYMLPGENEPLFEIACKLVQRPQSKGLDTTIPTNTRIRRIWLEQDTVYVDFSRELFAYRGGTYRERIMLGQIVYTFTQFSGIDKVQILIEGEKQIAPEGSLTDEPLKRSDISFDV
jgi:spore germination protein GerM